MKAENLKPQHQTSAIGQLLELKAQVVYHELNIAPFYSEMEAWEKKEYAGVYAKNIDALNQLKKHVIENESLFNDILNSYGLSVSVFLSKYASC